MMDIKILAVLMLFAHANGQLYEDKRCRCVCPSPAALLNNTMTDRKLYTGNVPPNKCNCDGVILPIVGDQLKGHEREFCPRCECKYERRNTTVIMVVVIMTLWSIMTLSVYMGFLICLDPLINKRRVKLYRESGGEEALNLLLQDDGED
ncbi:proton-transporting V-type ATPase complex assembly regulator TMEM9-like isoform X2 [Anticarsia gemmatalis]|uniref:proton-transporting V-type ATPase complex assembly regulator TMEM9-like isoform X2 n=1 Tax=Anticarsia gemmatalis TaxID=129554 RepID=UPI003F76E6D1